jgi:hypothetical protein
LNQLKNIDYSKTGSYITGSGIKRRGRGVSGEGLKVVKKTGRIYIHQTNITNSRWNNMPCYAYRCIFSNA